jgi:hypothetical protein
MARGTTSLHDWLVISALSSPTSPLLRREQRGGETTTWQDGPNCNVSTSSRCTVPAVADGSVNMRFFIDNYYEQVVEKKKRNERPIANLNSKPRT